MCTCNKHKKCFIISELKIWFYFYLSLRMHVARYEPRIAKCLPFIPTTKKALNKKISAMSQTTFCNGSKISEKTVLNNVTGHVFETPDLDSFEGSFFSFCCQENLIEYVVHSRHQQMLLRYEQILSYITSTCTCDIRLFVCIKSALSCVTTEKLYSINLHRIYKVKIILYNKYILTRKCPGFLNWVLLENNQPS